MTFDQFWDKLCKTNGLDKYTAVRLNVAELKRILRVAYEAGREESAESIRKMVGDDPIGQLFGR